jgi:hypothetical protein
MRHWIEEEIIPDRRMVELPASLEPGRYRLEIGFYSLDGGDRVPITDGMGNSLGQALTLDYVRVMAQTAPLPAAAQSVEVDLSGNGDWIRLLGYTLAADDIVAGGVLGLNLNWQALTPIRRDYTVFVHLLDDDEQIRGQGDGPPVAGSYPTSFWDPGEIVADERQVTVDADAPAGVYRLAVGLYLQPTGQRLVAKDVDRIILGTVQVE